MEKKAITLQQLEEALRDFTRWIRDKLRGYVAEPEAEGKSGYVLTTNGAGGRSWEPGGAEEPDKTLSIEGAAADAKAVGEKKADKPKTNGIMKAVNGSLVAAEAGVDYQAPIEAGEITAEKIADASVQRSKLATDALYSPMLVVNGSHTLTVEDVGKTIRGVYNDSTTINITAENSAGIPVGAEFALIAWGTNDDLVQIIFDSVQTIVSCESSIYTNGASVVIPDGFGMIAVKKVNGGPGATADVWFVTGNVEVVS